MILYCDTSALAKRHLDEPGKQRIEDLCRIAETLFTSAFTELEMTALVEQAKKVGRIRSPDYRGVLLDLEKDFHGTFLNLIDVSPEIIKASLRFIRLRRLRAPDAVQLASAVTTNQRLSSGLSFCCADHRLLEAARLEGLRCEDVSG